MKLFSYFRSSAAYRVRIALALKQLPYETIPVDLLAGAQRAASYLAKQPQGLVPLLEVGDLRVGQSLAILEYLEETHPSPPLLPPDAAGRARVRQISLTVACEVHPLCNLRILRYLERELGADEAARATWYQHFVGEGLAAIERVLTDAATGVFCHGDTPTLADVCLVPQVYNARRFDCPLEGYPLIREIEARCLALGAFSDAAPERQPDATP